ncbi:YdeI/OmpD-associated family protein [Neolewinella lacunae]|uniref:DUF1905 domain-containing protein n=1 Tax=Neolewinella lacunae TaxID=1517758 RepID=A0A923PJV1_9BACT|nr:YdeI/OmpD-associated family protein [Neolewinella lacunae]MBC6993046.1 DUF1905 domain-containing protein [Neolewinella lacunae]MDN3635868.1 YdeI/OmpD-associated family protein [Neolewinella lacunae]
MPSTPTPLIDAQLLLQKKDGKGGWTFAVITGIPPEARDKLGLVRVSGSIDGAELRQFNLLPLAGGGQLLPVKTAIRKKIRKQAGDYVHVILYLDHSPVEVPDEIEGCLLDAPAAHDFFYTLSPSNQKYYLDWIAEAQRFETKIERIARMIERLEKGWRFYDWPIKEGG